MIVQEQLWDEGAGLDGDLRPAVPANLASTVLATPTVVGATPQGDGTGAAGGLAHLMATTGRRRRPSTASSSRSLSRSRLRLIAPSPSSPYSLSPRAPPPQAPPQGPPSRIPTGFLRRLARRSQTPLGSDGGRPRWGRAPNPPPPERALLGATTAGFRPDGAVRGGGEWPVTRLRGGAGLGPGESGAGGGAPGPGVPGAGAGASGDAMLGGPQPPEEERAGRAAAGRAWKRSARRGKRRAGRPAAAPEGRVMPWEAPRQRREW